LILALADCASITRKVMRNESLAVAVPRGHPFLELVEPLKLRTTVAEPLINYPRSPRPSYADQVLSFFRDQNLVPRVAFKVKELQIALGLVAAGAGICIVPSSLRRLGRDDTTFLPLDEPTITSSIIMSYRTKDTSLALRQPYTLNPRIQ
jgi:LysR family transcriptional regulator, benzoate and cis,cis-muconate-responsive activator of ben and cat genes